MEEDFVKYLQRMTAEYLDTDLGKKRRKGISVKNLVAKVLAFVEHYNRTMAEPFKLTCKGKVLTT